MNRVILKGNLGADPEVKATSSGDTVMSLRLATNEPERQSDGSWGTRTEWHRVTMWGDRVTKLASMLYTGSEVLVEGRNRTRKWTDQSGTDRYTTEVVITQLEFCGPKQESHQTPSQRRAARPPPEVDPWGLGPGQGGPPADAGGEQFPYGANEPAQAPYPNQPPAAPPQQNPFQKFRGG